MPYLPYMTWQQTIRQSHLASHHQDLVKSPVMMRSCCKPARKLREQLRRLRKLVSACWRLVLGARELRERQVPRPAACER